MAILAALAFGVDLATAQSADFQSCVCMYDMHADVDSFTEWEDYDVPPGCPDACVEEREQSVVSFLFNLQNFQVTAVRFSCGSWSCNFNCEPVWKQTDWMSSQEAVSYTHLTLPTKA